MHKEMCDLRQAVKSKFNAQIMELEELDIFTTVRKKKLNAQLEQ